MGGGRFKDDIQSGEVVPKEIYLDYVKPAIEIAPAAVFGDGNTSIDTPARMAIEDKSEEDSAEEKY